MRWMLLVWPLAILAGAAQAQTGEAAQAAMEQARQTLEAEGCRSASLRLAMPPFPVPLRDPTVRQMVYVRVVAEGCGAPRLLNTLVASMTDGSRRLLPQPNGNTNADPVLQRDVRGPVLAAATMRAAPDCRDPRIVDTRLEGTAPTGPQPWQETWIVQACGVLVAVPVRFTPTAAGGTDYGVNPGGVRRLN